MKYIVQVFLILLFSLLGELLAYVIPLPIPAAIYGLVLLLIALCLRLVKPRQIHETAHFLLTLLPLLLVAPAANIIKYWGIVKSNLLAIIVASVVSTFLVLIVSGLVTKRLLPKKGGEEDG